MPRVLRADSRHDQHDRGGDPGGGRVAGPAQQGDRQGAGAFVAPDIETRPFRLAFDGLPSIAEVLEVMELRASVEVEAAALAASRGTFTARRRVGRALAAIEAALGEGGLAFFNQVYRQRRLAAVTDSAPALLGGSQPTDSWLDRHSSNISRPSSAGLSLLHWCCPDAPPRCHRP